MARKLDRLQPSNAPGLPRGIYTNQQRVCEQVETLFDEQATINAALAAQVADIAAALAAGTAAQLTADAVKKTDKISGSFAYAAVAPLMTATDAGADASITVKSHTRQWGDGSSTPGIVTHTFTGLLYDKPYFAYYDDPNQNLTNPTYHITTNVSTAANNSATGRVFVGTITTPTSGGADTEGGTTPPGGGDIPAKYIQ